MWIPVWSKLAVLLGIFFLVFLLFFVFILVRKIIEFLLKKNNRKFSIIIRKDVDVALFIAGICASVLLIASFFAPNVLSIYPPELSQSSNLATTMNGLMSPFIAIAAAILTFMAFWVQYTANANIHAENKKQQDERQFYEMLKIHRDNVDKLEFVHLESEEEANYNEYVRKFHVSYLSEKRHVLIHSKGQSAIQYFLKELRCIYNVIPAEDPPSGRFKYAYDVFFNGLTFCPYLDRKEHICKKFEKSENKICESMGTNEKLCKKKIEINKLWRNDDELPQSSIMNGHKAELNPYYRHLYLTVKLVVESNFEKPEKEKYLKILRASLTAEEQVLILFNWYFGYLHKSGYGLKWENQDQKFFTEWGMIHNIVKKDFEFVEEMNDFEKITKILLPNLKDAEEIKKKTKELFNEY